MIDRTDALNNLLGLLDKVQADLQVLLGPAPTRPDPPLWSPPQRAGLSAAKSYVQDSRDTVASVLKSL